MQYRLKPWKPTQVNVFKLLVIEQDCLHDQEANTLSHDSEELTFVELAPNGSDWP